MHKITETSWLSFEGKEAELTVSDGKHSFKCFAHPWTGGAELSENTVFELLDAIVTATAETESYLKPIDNNFAYELVGSLSDVKRMLVRVGEFIFRIDSSLPGDLTQNSNVSVICDRISW